MSATVACAGDPRTQYEAALDGSRWQLTFGTGTPFLGCNNLTACLQPVPKHALLPSGAVTDLEPGCTGAFQITISDESHPFAEQTSFEQTCTDGSSLACTGDESTNQLACRWESGAADWCGGCAFDATLVQVE